jgi:indolepyruvate ferredoxin oxidoreductase
LLVERLAPVLGNIGPGGLWLRRGGLIAGAAVNQVRAAGERKISIPIRTPTFCPGCPHRDSSTVTKAIKKDFLDPAYMKPIITASPWT